MRWLLRECCTKPIKYLRRVVEVPPILSIIQCQHLSLSLASPLPLIPPFMSSLSTSQQMGSPPLLNPPARSDLPLSCPYPCLWQVVVAYGKALHIVQEQEHMFSSLAPHLPRLHFLPISSCPAWQVSLSLNTFHHHHHHHPQEAMK